MQRLHSFISLAIWACMASVIGHLARLSAVGIILLLVSAGWLLADLWILMAEATRAQDPTEINKRGNRSLARFAVCFLGAMPAIIHMVVSWGIPIWVWIVSGSLLTIAAFLALINRGDNNRGYR